MSDNAPATPETTPEAPAKDESGAKPDEPLGAPGLAALNAERDRADKAEKAAKAALAKIQEFEDRDKSEAQKQQEALEKAQKELAELTVAKLRAEVAAATDALIAFKGEQPKQKLIIPSEGGQPTTKVSNAEQFAALVEEQLS